MNAELCHFDSNEAAQGSLLAKRLFQSECVRAILISHDQVTITRTTTDQWPVIGKMIGAAIRDHLATGEPAVSEVVRRNIPPADQICQVVQQALDRDINPSVAEHGGIVRLMDIKDNIVDIQMGGGCQDCGTADVTLKHGIETAIRGSSPGAGDILDVTDHASGRNPYFTPATK